MRTEQITTQPALGPVNVGIVYFPRRMPLWRWLWLKIKAIANMRVW